MTQAVCLLLCVRDLRDQDLDNGSLYGGAARHGTPQPALCPADGFDSMSDHVVIGTAIAAAPRDLVCPVRRKTPTFRAVRMSTVCVVS